MKIGHVDWLLNRIKELELEVNDWRAEAQKWQQFYEESEESHFETIELLHSTSRVVKRYRQALELIYKDTFYESEHDLVSPIHVIRKRAEKALEGET